MDDTTDAKFKVIRDPWREAQRRSLIARLVVVVVIGVMACTMVVAHREAPVAVLERP